MDKCRSGHRGSCALRHAGRRFSCTAAACVLVCAAGVLPASFAAETPGDAQTTSGQRQVELTLRAELPAEALRRGELFRELPDPAGFGVERIVAFEDNPTFLYLCGISTCDAVNRNADSAPHQPQPDPTHVRRIFLLKPSDVVVDDQVRGGGQARVSWTLQSKAPLALREGDISGTVGEERFVCRTLLPGAGERSLARSDASGGRARHTVRLLAETPSEKVRLLHVLHFEGEADPAVPESILRRRQGTLHIELSVWDELMSRHRAVQLSLPEGRLSGKIGIFDREGDGFLDVPTRPLPAGVLPMGEAGLRMLQGWDIPYRDMAQGLAIWDTGRPSPQLKKVVRAGAVRPCRVVELGCGTGTDAVYLAGKGFDVTAVDIAPTALALAEKKACKADVKVRWLLADVLRLPELKPFDFLYDRGCYHAIRRDFPEQYVAGVRRLTRPGSRILILAGSAKEDSRRRFAGPPRVTEKEIRGDFADGFKLIRLREFRFDPAPRETQGALAWSVLLERVADEQEAAQGRER